ncbi:AMP-binding protein-like protein, partial [Leptotrombidium deliense]
GTTGSPKAAALSHYNLTNNTRFFGERLGFKADKDVTVCLPVPIFHCFGSVLGTTTMVTTGATMVMPSYRYDVKSVVEAMVRFKCTHFMGVPAMLIDIMNYVEDNNIQIKSLMGVITAATTVPFDVVQRFSSLIPSIQKIDIVYGATETSPIITSPLPESKLEDTLDNVGLPLDFAEVKLIDRETKQIVKIGEKGTVNRELWTRGPHVMIGYWNEEEQTKNAISARKWYNTGDLATMDANGCFRIVGRTKEIIIRGGINIYPREIEDVLITHPLIKNAAVSFIICPTHLRTLISCLSFKTVC